MMKYCILFLLVGLYSCDQLIPFGDDSNSKSILKKSKHKSLAIDMFTYATAYAESPTYLVVQKNKLTDTICTSTNLKTFKVEKDTLRLYFIGSPKKYTDLIQVKIKTFDELIIDIDTTARPRFENKTN